METGIHYLDQVAYLTESEDVVVTTARAIMARGLDYELRAEAILRPSEVPVRILFSRLRNSLNQFEFQFENAKVLLSLEAEARPVVMAHRSGHDRRFALTPIFGEPLVDGVDKAFGRFWSLFFEAIARSAPNLTSAVSSRVTTKWIEQIYKKLEESLTEARAVLA